MIPEQLVRWIFYINMFIKKRVIYSYTYIVYALRLYLYCFFITKERSSQP